MVATAVRSSKRKAKTYRPDGPAGAAEEISAAELKERMTYELGDNLLFRPKELDESATGPEHAAENVEAVTAVMEPPPEPEKNKPGTNYVLPDEDKLKDMKTADGKGSLGGSDRVTAFVKKWGKKK